MCIYPVKIAVTEHVLLFSTKGLIVLKIFWQVLMVYWNPNNLFIDVKRFIKVIKFAIPLEYVGTIFRDNICYEVAAILLAIY